MKLGEGGEAFFVFQTEGDIPENMQTSPLVSPDQSPILHITLSAVFPPIQNILLIQKSAMGLQEPDYLDLNNGNGKFDIRTQPDDAKSEIAIQLHAPLDIVRPASTDGTPDFGARSLPTHPTASSASQRRPQSGDWSGISSAMDHLSLESLKEPSSNGFSSRRHTVSMSEDKMKPFPTKVPQWTQTVIERLADAINKMGGQVQTHVQDSGGKSPINHIG